MTFIGKMTDSPIELSEVRFNYLRKFQILLESDRFRDSSVPPVHMIFCYRPDNVKVFFTIEIHVNRCRHGIIIWKDWGNQVVAYFG